MKQWCEGEAVDPEEDILKSANATYQSVIAKDAGLSGHTQRMLVAATYYVTASSMGRPISMYDAEEMFGVADYPFRQSVKKVAEMLKVKLEPHTKERSRNAYDIYALILQNQGKNLTSLIRSIHVKYSEIEKHLNLLVSHGLLREEKDGRTRLYFPTARGRQYLEAYRELREAIAEHQGA